MAFHHRFLARYQEMGFQRTFRYVIMRLIDPVVDLIYDRRYGVRTSGLTVPLVAGGEGYKASFPSVLRDTIAGLDICYENFTFVDLGSGKGRSLLIASGFPFRRVVGVEYSPELHAIAAANISRYRGPRRCREVQAMQADVRTFPIPDGPLVFYMYHPFQEPVVNAMLAHLREDLERKPRPVYFLYMFPVYGELLERAGYQRVGVRRSRLMDHLDIAIYRAASIAVA